MTQQPMQQQPMAQQPPGQMPQQMGPVTFEPYNPGQPFANPAAPINPAAPAIATGQDNSVASTLSNFIQGEKNAALFYNELHRFAGDEYSRNILHRVADNANGRKTLLNSLYSKVTGSAHSDKDTPIMKSTNLRDGIRAAIEVEHNTVRDMSALYDQIENGAQLKSLNSVIQKKLADIIALQQIAIYAH